jgi:hypothetical protein
VYIPSKIIFYHYPSGTPHNESFTESINLISEIPLYLKKGRFFPLLSSPPSRHNLTLIVALDTNLTASGYLISDDGRETCIHFHVQDGLIQVSFEG